MAIRRAPGAKLVEQLQQRLDAADARVEQLARELDEVRRDLAGREERTDALRQDVNGRLDADVARLDGEVARLEALGAEQVEALSTLTATNHRRHAGFIDVLRRSQKSLDERLTAEGTERRSDVERIHRLMVDQATRHSETTDRLAQGAQHATNRLDALTQEIDELRLSVTQRHTAIEQRVDAEFAAARQSAIEGDDALRRSLADLADAVERGAQQRDERLAGLDQRAGLLESAARTAAERFEELDGFRSDLATILDRIGATLESSHSTIERLLGRADALESTVRVQAIEVGAVANHYETARADLDQALARLDELAAQAAAVDDHLRLTAERLAPLAPLPATVQSLDLHVTELGDRVTAAELLLNQRDDLELQLDRAEEFERTLSELNPDRYATREALDEVRAALDELRSVDHDA